jgi:hypothetical protein
MNQVADSRKKNLRPIVAKYLICLQGWHLSHIMQCGELEKDSISGRMDSKMTHCVPLAR